MGVGAERPKTWGGSTAFGADVGRIDPGRIDSGADRLWGGSTGTQSGLAAALFTLPLILPRFIEHLCIQEEQN